MQSPQLLAVIGWLGQQQDGTITHIDEKLVAVLDPEFSRASAGRAI
jgi:hypothetical protein